VIKSKNHPTHRELLVFEDGRIYDQTEERWLTLMTDHGMSNDGPVSMWYSVDKMYRLDTYRMIYEAFNGKVGKEYAIKLRDLAGPISLSNLVKICKNSRECKTLREEKLVSWMGGNEIYMW